MQKDRDHHFARCGRNYLEDALGHNLLDNDLFSFYPLLDLGTGSSIVPQRCSEA
jgi:hypothetical protein